VRFSVFSEAVAPVEADLAVELLGIGWAADIRTFADESLVELHSMNGIKSYRVLSPIRACVQAGYRDSFFEGCVRLGRKIRDGIETGERARWMNSLEANLRNILHGFNLAESGAQVTQASDLASALQEPVALITGRTDCFGSLVAQDSSDLGWPTEAAVESVSLSVKMQEAVAAGDHHAAGMLGLRLAHFWADKEAFFDSGALAEVAVRQFGMAGEPAPELRSLELLLQALERQGDHDRVVEIQAEIERLRTRILALVDNESAPGGLP